MCNKTQELSSIFSHPSKPHSPKMLKPLNFTSCVQTGVGQLQVLEKLQTVTQSQSVPASVRISNKLLIPLVITLIQEIWSSINTWTLILFFSTDIHSSKKKSVLFIELKHQRQNRCLCYILPFYHLPFCHFTLYVTLCHTDLKAYTVCLYFPLIMLESEEWHSLIVLLISCFGRNQNPFQNTGCLSYAWLLFM